MRLPGEMNGFSDRKKTAIRDLSAYGQEERKMKKRDLYAEIAEGFDALSNWRKGKPASCNISAPGETEGLVGDSDAWAYP